jgi:hypothetical protein
MMDLDTVKEIPDITVYFKTQGVLFREPDAFAEIWMSFPQVYGEISTYRYGTKFECF